jgi:hypothetical protein
MKMISCLRCPQQAGEEKEYPYYRLYWDDPFNGSNLISALKRISY